jgi:hypothetical protein
MNMKQSLGQKTFAGLGDFAGQAFQKLILHVIQSAAKDLYVRRTLKNQAVELLQFNRVLDQSEWSMHCLSCFTAI